MPLEKVKSGNLDAFPRSAWLARLSVACWVAWLTSALLFFIFWRLFTFPHAAWGVLSCVAVAGLTISAVIVGFWQIAFGPHRWRSMGYLLLVLAPLLWFGSYILEISTLARRRADLHFGVFGRTAITWIVSVAEAEARWRWHQWVRGRHVVLVDDGRAENVGDLVAEADEHVGHMAKQLGRGVPEKPLYWVRRELIRRGGCAICNFALCNHGDANPAEMTSTDRHELAHALIFVMSGPDQNPPAIFEEGWAQVHSGPPANAEARRNTSIQWLAEEKRQGEAYSLQTLIAPGRYKASRGEAYSYGEPLAHYLLERFGGQRYLALYSGVRRDTFSADCERIVGQSFESLEVDFWNWLEAEDERLAKENMEQLAEHEAYEPALADGVSRDDWQVFVAGYRAANQDGLAFPRNTSFKLSLTGMRTPGRDGLETETTAGMWFQGVFSDDSFWVYGIRDGTEEIYWSTPTAAAHFYGPEGALLKGRLHQYTDPGRIQDLVMSSLLSPYYAGYNLPSAIISLGESSASTIPVTITKIERPVDDDWQPWVFEFQTQMTDDETNQVVDRSVRYTVDPTKHWWIIDCNQETSTGKVYKSRMELVPMGYGILPIAIEQHYEGPDYKAEVLVKMQSMSDGEIQALKERVNREIRRSQLRDPAYWASWTGWIAIGLAAIGLVLLKKG